ncbi:MAG TPA: GntR family transcriptional regulator [Gammaproteobacteria bacterium]|nr:GntR family transcriptional regulator [Gammaproteobacteria bacterium]
MVNIGQINHLKIAKTVDFGVYLDGEDLGEILLPKRYIPEGAELGDSLEVFLYHDSDDRLIATTETPKATVAQCAALKVVQINRIGAFLDWGLSKDLLVPYNEQIIPMKEGNTYVVYPFIDEQSGRITGSSRLDDYLPETSIYLRPRQAVEIQIWGKSDLGYKAVIDGAVLGLLYSNEIFRPLRVGQKLSAFIKTIREDKRIDLALQLSGSQANEREQLTDRILQHLQTNNGTSTLTDKSPPDDIYQQYHVSKGSYKKALGALYSQRKITISKDLISLV